MANDLLLEAEAPDFDIAIPTAPEEEQELTLEEKLSQGIFNDDWRLAIKRNYRLRSDEKRVLFVEIDEDTGEIMRHGVLMPQLAIAIAHFNGVRTFEEACLEVASLFEIDVEKVKSDFFLPVFKGYANAFALRNEIPNFRVFDPNEYVIPADQVDMTTSRLYRPMSMVLHIADSCMRECIYCSVEKTDYSERGNALTPEQVLDVIDQAADLGIVSMGVAGGDPFMRKDIVEIMERIHLRDIAATLSTKGFVSKKRARRLKEVGVESMQVSVDAPHDKLADFLTGSPGSFKQAIASIEHLVDVGIRVRTNSVITHHNVRHTPKLIELLVSMGVIKIGLAAYARSLNNGKFADSLFMSFKDASWLRDEVNKLREKHGTIINGFEIPLDHGLTRPEDKARRYKERAMCSAGKSAFVLREDGTVVLCEECPVTEFLTIGNVKDSSLEEIWNSPKILEITHPPREKYKGTACYKCPDFDECHTVKGRCWRETLKAYDKFYMPAPLCPRAPRGKRIY